MSKLYRDYGPALLMLGVSLVLVLVLFAEWVHFRGEHEALKGRLALKEAVNPQTGDDAAHDYTLPDLDQYAEMIARPLFLEGRRPPPEDDQAAQDTPVAGKPLNLKLMGVVFTPRERVALFVDLKGKYQRLRKNAVVDGWKLVELHADRAIMEQAGEQKELPLLKPKPKVAKPTEKPKTGKAEIRGPDEIVDQGGDATGDADDDEPDEMAGPDDEDGDDSIDETDVTDQTDEMIDESADDGTEFNEDSDE